jgi:hypothetical protein
MPVHLQQSARDLQQIAKSVVANPTVGKKVLHSSFFDPHRRAVQSKGAFGSYVASGVKKGVSIALGQIPVPAVGMILDKAWSAANDAIRTKLHQNHITSVATTEEKVKFELKEIGSDVADWDRYRWKIAHAVEQYNKVTNEVRQAISSAPCDTWVRVWAKYYYLASRIAKLRASVEAVRAILKEVDEWLEGVEKSYSSTQAQIQGLFDKDVAGLKIMQVHDTCSDTKCMFKQGQWTAKANVPTSDAANFFIAATSKAVSVMLDDPISDAVDVATSC